MKCINFRKSANHPACKSTYTVVVSDEIEALILKMRKNLPIVAVHFSIFQHLIFQFSLERKTILWFVVNVRQLLCVQDMLIFHFVARNKDKNPKTGKW